MNCHLTKYQNCCRILILVVVKNSIPVFVKIIGELVMNYDGYSNTHEKRIMFAINLE
jgi:hypothetical protein